MGAAASAKSGKYVGQLLRGTVRHGRGSCALSDGSYYEGDWCGYRLALVCVLFHVKCAGIWTRCRVQA
jgi:hypothetical protein